MARQPNPSILRERAPRLTVWEGVGWMLGGLLLGLLIGWVIWPVHWTDAEPDDLHPEARAYYISATADAYVASGGQEPALALRRMQSFDDPQAAVMDAIAYFRRSNDPNRAIREVNLRSLASALNAQLYAVAGDTPRQSEPDLSWQNWLIGIVTGILLIGGGVWVWRRWQSVQTRQPAPQTTPGPGQTAPSGWVNPPGQTPPDQTAAGQTAAGRTPGDQSATGPDRQPHQPASPSPEDTTPAAAHGGWQPSPPPDRAPAPPPQTGDGPEQPARPRVQFETFDTLPEDEIGEIQRITPGRDAGVERFAGIDNDDEDDGPAVWYEDDEDGDEDPGGGGPFASGLDDDEDAGDEEDDNGFVDYAVSLNPDEDEDESTGGVADPDERLASFFDRGRQSTGSADLDSDASGEDDSEDAYFNGDSEDVEADEDEPDDNEADAEADDEEASGFLPVVHTVQGVLSSWRKPEKENQPQSSRSGRELGNYIAEYNAGILSYEQSFTITANGKDDGTPLGACGMGVNEELDKSAAHTNKVHVLDVWLYDGEDVRSAKQLLVSPGVDMDALGQATESAGTITGEPLEIAPGLSFRIACRNLLMDCRVLRADFLDSEGGPQPLRALRIEMKVRSAKQS